MPEWDIWVYARNEERDGLRTFMPVDGRGAVVVGMNMTTLDHLIETHNPRKVFAVDDAYDGGNPELVYAPCLPLRCCNHRPCCALCGGQPPASKEDA